MVNSLPSKAIDSEKMFHLLQKEQSTLQPIQWIGATLSPDIVVGRVNKSLIGIPLVQWATLRRGFELMGSQKCVGVFRNKVLVGLIATVRGPLDEPPELLPGWPVSFNP